MRALILLCLFMVSCTPQKRLERLLKNHPELRDTVYHKDTIRIQGDKSDTLFMQSTTKDTVVLEKGRLLMKYYYSHDTVFLQGECKDSVIVREIPVQSYKADKGISPWWVAFILVLFIALMILLK